MLIEQPINLFNLQVEPTEEDELDLRSICSDLSVCSDEDYDAFDVDDKLQLSVLNNDLVELKKCMDTYEAYVNFGPAIATIYKQLHPGYKSYNKTKDMRNLLFSYQRVKNWLRTKDGREEISRLELVNKFKHYTSIVFHDFSKDKIHMSILLGTF